MNAKLLHSTSWCTDRSGVTLIVGGTNTTPYETHIAFLKEIDTTLQRLSTDITQYLLKYHQEMRDSVFFDSWEQHFDLKTILIRKVEENKVLWQIRFEEKRDDYEFTMYLTDYNIEGVEIDYIQEP